MKRMTKKIHMNIFFGCSVFVEKKKRNSNFFGPFFCELQPFQVFQMSELIPNEFYFSFQNTIFGDKSTWIK